MRGMIVGSALVCGCAYAALSGVGGPGSQHVQATPEKTYSAFADAFADVEQSGVGTTRAGEPVAYQIEVDKVPDKSIDVVWLVAGDEAGRLHLTFAPQGQGGTLVGATAHADQDKISDALSHRVDPAKPTPLVLSNWGLRSMLEVAAQQIQAGDPIQNFTYRPHIPGEWNDAARRTLNTQRMYDATKPSLDPSADARKFLHQP